MAATAKQVEPKSSTPSFSDFDPSEIPWQDDLIDDMLCRFDYSLGIHQILLSGTVGSGKSLPAAHMGIRDCLEYPGCRGLIGRQAMPDLKLTLFKKIKEHLAGTEGLKRDRDYWINETNASVKFKNGSEIIGYSWSEKDWESFGSLELSWAIIEEASENQGEYREAFYRLLTRVGRQPHVPRNWIMALTNPDGPSHWLYSQFELDRDEGVDEPPVDRDETKHVYYSRTEDNPYLPEWYITELEKNLDPKTADRLLRGRWVDIRTEYVYHAYDRAYNYRQRSYEPDTRFPIHISWDFNIGEGKPLSAVLFQYIQDEIHIFGEVVVEGMRTEDSCEELAGRGYLEHPVQFIVNGDATGRSRDTRSNKSDYGIIERFFANYKTSENRKLAFKVDVPRANPSVRDRHNRVNAYCKNSLGTRRLFVYKDAPTADKALRMTQLKSGGRYIEDDTKHYQHIGTAIGYGLMAASNAAGQKPQATVRL